MTKAKIKKIVKSHNEYEVKFNLTLGEVISIKNALEMYSQHSPVADDVRCYLRNACLDAGVEL
jgi:hypothetical protein